MKLHVTERANREMLAALTWYESSEAGVGLEFLRAFDASLYFVTNHPLASPLVLGELRRAWMRRFPYALYYCVRGDTVFIAAVLHAAQDPDSVDSESG